MKQFVLIRKISLSLSLPLSLSLLHAGSGVMYERHVWEREVLNNFAIKRCFFSVFFFFFMIYFIKKIVFSLIF